MKHRREEGREETTLVAELFVAEWRSEAISDGAREGVVNHSAAELHDSREDAEGGTVQLDTALVTETTAVTTHGTAEAVTLGNVREEKTVDERGDG